MTETIRETLEAAFEQHEPDTTPEPVAEQPADTAQEPAAPAPEATEAPTAATTARARDEHGRFAKAAADAAAAAKAGEATAQASPPAPVAPPAPPKSPAVDPTAAELNGVAETLKPPAQWKPSEREVWAQIPKPAQEAIVRRANEDRAALQQHFEARKNWDRLREAAAPYQQFMAMNGHNDPVASAANMWRTAATIYHGTPQQKAGVIAALIKESGTPVELLDAMLAGQPVPQQHQQPVNPQMIAQQVRQSILQELEAKRAEVVGKKVQSDVEAFAAKHEWFDDVRDDMADLIAAKAQRGVEMSMDQAYTAAVSMRPDLSEIVAQRKASETARAQMAQTQRSKVAGSSIKAIPAEPVTRSTGRRSIREDVEAAFASQR